MAVTLISHTEVGSGGAANIEFASIPGTYDDLWLVTSLRTNETSTVSGVYAVLNNDTGANYSRTLLYASGTTPASIRATSSTNAFRVAYATGSTATSSTFGSSNLYLPSYSNTSNHKQGLTEGAPENNSSSTFNIYCDACLWRSTSAITSVKLVPLGGSFVQYSTATLYGIKKF